MGFNSGFKGLNPVFRRETARLGKVNNHKTVNTTDNIVVLTVF